MHYEFARCLSFNFLFDTPISEETNLARMRDAMHESDVDSEDLRLVVRDAAAAKSRRGAND
ncbi:hypothetical protein LG3211_3818 [Lysobacter gummosus]|nr:hypothetical protein LG3211_3818 [Lysobacter gummosus]